MILKILGTGSATPTLEHYPSAQVLMAGNDYFLIDCGEGTQYRILQEKIKYVRIKHIFISHLHGDHYFGLIGLLSSWNLNGRKDDLTIIAPRGLAEILTLQFQYSGTVLRFKVNFIETDTQKHYQVLETWNFTIETIPLTHRVPCCGFLFRQKTGERKIIKEKLPDDFSVEWIKKLKIGENIVDDEGNVLHDVENFTMPAAPPKSYAYCSDTCYLESIIPIVKNVDLLYHEATFIDADAKRATETFHSTAKQAAEIAQKAGVKQLIIGHYSSRYKELESHLSEAKSIFDNTHLAEEGKTYQA